MLVASGREMRDLRCSVGTRNMYMCSIVRSVENMLVKRMTGGWVLLGF